jgi:hypothetical protein
MLAFPGIVLGIEISPALRAELHADQDDGGSGDLVPAISTNTAP